MANGRVRVVFFHTFLPDRNQPPFHVFIHHHPTGRFLCDKIPLSCYKRPVSQKFFSIASIKYMRLHWSFNPHFFHNKKCSCHNEKGKWPMCQHWNHCNACFTRDSSCNQSVFIVDCHWWWPLFSPKMFILYVRVKVKQWWKVKQLSNFPFPHVYTDECVVYHVPGLDTITATCTLSLHSFPFKSLFLVILPGWLDPVDRSTLYIISYMVYGCIT